MLRYGPKAAFRYSGLDGRKLAVACALVASSTRPIPAEFGMDGYFYRYQRHFVYWKRLADGDIGIVTILHQRMHQIERFRDDFGGKS